MLCKWEPPPSEDTMSREWAPPLIPLPGPSKEPLDSGSPALLLKSSRALLIFLKQINFNPL